jgi:hypothetical protein
MTVFNSTPLLTIIAYSSMPAQAKKSTDSARRCQGCTQLSLSFIASPSLSSDAPYRNSPGRMPFTPTSMLMVTITLVAIHQGVCHTPLRQSIRLFVFTNSLAVDHDPDQHQPIRFSVEPNPLAEPPTNPFRVFRVSNRNSHWQLPSPSLSQRERGYGNRWRIQASNSVPLVCASIVFTKLSGCCKVSNSGLA